MAHVAAMVSMHGTDAQCIRLLRTDETRLLTWTLLIWTAQAAFDLFVWVLLILLVVTVSYRRRH